MLNFGTVGSGWITDSYIQGAKESGLWRLTAVYSRTEERAREFAEKHQAEVIFTDLVEMAKSDKLDAVYISSPNVAHFEQCKIFLENGKHVICEKPICAQAKKVRELVKLAEEKDLIFIEAIMYLHLPQRKILENAIGEIGELSMAKIDFCQRSSKLDSYLNGELPNIFNPQLETGSLMDLGVYCVYPALALFGVPESFSASASIMKSGADGNGVVTMSYPDKQVVLTYSKTGQAGANTDFQGTKGTVCVDSISRVAGIRIWTPDGAVKELWDDEEKHTLMGWEAKDFYRYITAPEDSKEEYQRCKDLCIQVAEFMESVRKKAGIHFASDK